MLITESTGFHRLSTQHLHKVQHQMEVLWPNQMLNIHACRRHAVFEPNAGPASYHLPTPYNHIITRRLKTTAPRASNLHRHPAPGQALKRPCRPPPTTTHTSKSPPPRIHACRRGSVRHATRTTSATGLDRAPQERRAWSTRTGIWPGPWRRTPSTLTGPTGSSGDCCTRGGGGGGGGCGEACCTFGPAAKLQCRSASGGGRKGPGTARKSKT